MEKKKIVEQSGFLEAPFVRMLRMRSASLKINFRWRALTTCIKYRIPTVLLTKEQAYLLINHAMWCNTLIERTRGVR